MRVFIAVLVLIFSLQSWTKANDIREFEIEGVSIGDSFLNHFKKNIIEKASILINGVSLTISKVTKNGFEVWIIPHTYKLTNLSKLKMNSLVNIEIDILSKYVKKYFNEK